MKKYNFSIIEGCFVVNIDNKRYIVDTSLSNNICVNSDSGFSAVIDGRKVNFADSNPRRFYEKSYDNNVLKRVNGIIGIRTIEEFGGITVDKNKGILEFGSTLSNNQSSYRTYAKTVSMNGCDVLVCSVCINGYNENVLIDTASKNGYLLNISKKIDKNVTIAYPWWYYCQCDKFETKIIEKPHNIKIGIESYEHSTRVIEMHLNSDKPVRYNGLSAILSINNFEWDKFSVDSVNREILFTTKNDYKTHESKEYCNYIVNHDILTKFYFSHDFDGKLNIPKGIKIIGGLKMSEDYFHSDICGFDDVYDVFSENNKIREIIIPNSVEVIGDKAFWGCKNISVIQIPKSIKYIGKDIVGSYYNSIKNIYYDGSIEDFHDIDIRSRLDCDCIYCTNGIIDFRKFFFIEWFHYGGTMKEWTEKYKKTYHWLARRCEKVECTDGIICNGDLEHGNYEDKYITVENYVVKRMNNCGSYHMFIPECVKSIDEKAFDTLKGTVTVHFFAPYSKWERMANPYKHKWKGIIKMVNCLDEHKLV